MATICAICFPGAGQLCNREPAKGLVLVAIAAISILIMLNSKFFYPDVHNAQDWLFSPPVCIAGIILACAWIYGLLDVSAGARRNKKKSHDNDEL
jgi:hypothetical protein